MRKFMHFLVVVCVIFVYTTTLVAGDPQIPRPFGSSNSDGSQIPLTIPRPIETTPKPTEAAPKMRTTIPFTAPKNAISHSIPNYRATDFPSGPKQFDYGEAFQDLPVSSPGRWLHTGVVLGNKMYIYGGISSYTDKLYNDMWVYDYRMSSWNQLQRSYIPPLAPGDLRPKDIPDAPSYKASPSQFARPKPGVPVYDLPFQPVIDGIGFAEKAPEASNKSGSKPTYFMEMDNVVTKTIDPNTVYPQLVARSDARKELLRNQFRKLYQVQDKKHNLPSFNTLKSNQPPHDWPAVPNELWEYDLDVKTWKCVPSHGQRPSESQGENSDSKPMNRWLHTAVNIADNMIVFGGASNEEKIMGDLWVFDPTTYKWMESHPQAGTQRPLPRQGHCAASVGTTMYIFGGISYGYQPFNDVWAYDSVNNVWTELAPNQPHKGVAPRWLTSCAAVEDAPGKVRLFVFGGVSKEYVPLNDFVQFDVQEKSWSQISAADGRAPAPRMLHSLVQLGSRLYVVGGMSNNIPFDDLHYFDLNYEVWSEVLPTGAFPFARGGASVARVVPIASATPDRPIYPKMNFNNRPNDRWSPRYRKVWNQNNFFVMFGGVGTVQL